jgi:hypothetical protein
MQIKYMLSFGGFQCCTLGQLDVPLFPIDSKEKIIGKFTQPVGEWPAGSEEKGGRVMKKYRGR